MLLRAFLIALISIASAAAGPTKTRNIILVTADGLRWQDLFGGMDPVLMNEKAAGMEKAQGHRDRLWKETPEERRKALMPFFWAGIAPKGVVLGNVNKQSSVQVSNSYRVSYPGYSEILTGRAQDEAIRGNNKIQNPTPTILEFLRQKLSLDRSKVALFGTWEVFPFIGESRRGATTINAGYQNWDASPTSPRLRELSSLQHQLLTESTGERHDYITFEMALEFLKQAQPRFLHIAFGETDSWAHGKRYDRVLDSIGYFDQSLKKLWETIQSMPQYRGNTTLVITSDHGRGSTPQDFTSHGSKVQGAEQIWLAVIGPDTPAKGELANSEPAMQRDITPTMLTLLGIDYKEYAGVEGKPILAVLK